MNLINRYSFLIALAFVAVISACTKEYASISEEDDTNIQAYISANNLSMQKFDTTGAYYSVVSEGKGPDLDYTQQLPLIYTVKSLDGKYTSQDTFVNHYAGRFGYYTPDVLRETIKANLKKEGGTIRVLVPSRKAYGRNGSGQIPGNASLDYTVKVLEKAKLAEYEDAVIQNYLSKNSLTGFSKSADNIWYKITEPGAGSKTIEPDSTITFNYTGRLLNGTVFETNEGVSTVLSGYIPSWQKAVPLIKEGGSIRFIAPSSFSYGLAGSPASSVGQVSIPAFAPLDFEVKVTKVGR
ncbi:FKBP-type peptidyl-prolyl cis-trans isomerase [Arcticibacter pallidicorallinus]|uniref:Peptidyl-prolyl cis-trans isomerase n=1 Tax=Arcticibacter pallidicorallinus TaxID=1259464 RepID=A0A2T0U904_9SPHI|nr:FKBP-type peptidyl-prolyl cis-trans isomerase [Arcticibacter pallidicorallinus]PRY54413.1 FKBP-type peptidyl-prolyl cis-trans isomerase [Arcticibacter pallidicorallinus]